MWQALPALVALVAVVVVWTVVVWRWVEWRVRRRGGAGEGFSPAPLQSTEKACNCETHDERPLLFQSTQTHVMVAGTFTDFPYESTQFRRAIEAMRRRSDGARGTDAAWLVGELAGDELDVIGLVVERLEIGRARYGQLDIATDRRDWRGEKRQELVDGLIYDVIDARKRSASAPARGGEGATSAPSPSSPLSGEPAGEVTPGGEVRKSGAGDASDDGDGRSRYPAFGGHDLGGEG